MVDFAGGRRTDRPRQPAGLDRHIHSLAARHWFPGRSLLFLFFEITPQGIVLEKDVERDESITHVTGRRLEFIVISLLCAAVILFAYEKWWISGSPVHSIAVLPFVNMSDDPGNEYFSDGLSEELLNLLAKISEIKVISRSSAFSFKGKDFSIPTVAAELNVAHVLEGSVRKTGNRVRISAQLIEAHSDTHLWSETYDRTLSDIFAIQDEIAAKVVDQLKISLLGELPKQQEADPDAYAFYLQVNHLNEASTAESLGEAITLFEKVLAIDPNYVAAWLGMGRSFERMGTIRVLSQAEARKKSKQANERALEIDPHSAGAMKGLAWRLFQYDGNLQDAAHYFEKALLQDPTNTVFIGDISIFLSSLGRLEDAIRFGEYQVSRDPASAVAHNNLGGRYKYAGNFSAAEKAYSTARRLSPTLVGVNYEIGSILLSEGKFALARTMFESETLSAFSRIGLSMSYYAQGEHDKSLELLKDLISNYGDKIPYYIGLIMAFQGDIDRAFEWLDTARAAEDSALSNTANEPLLENLHSDPRWLPFLESIGRAPEQLNAIQFSVSLPK
ncbi:MAG: tetratricopeptide repeat protein [Woeseia sp.]|nr:tetratricopeptide repeat protein [Woeseia sp.]